MQIDCDYKTVLAVDPVSGGLRRPNQMRSRSGMLKPVGWWFGGSRWRFPRSLSVAMADFWATVPGKGAGRVWTADGDLRLWLEGYENSVTSLSLDHGASLVAAESASAVTVWDFQRGALRYTLRPQGKYIAQVEFHGSDGRLMARPDSELAVHDAPLGRRLHTLWRGRGSHRRFCGPSAGLLSGGQGRPHFHIALEQPRSAGEQLARG